LSSLLDLLQAQVIEHLLERWEGCRVHEDGAKVFEVLVQPTQNVQHENTISDVDAEIDEGVGKALHLPSVVVDAEVALNEALESGIDVVGMSLSVAEEVVLQC
jgi:translation initiation factor 2 alpha subunit (eIF-2alpha)